MNECTGVSMLRLKKNLRIRAYDWDKAVISDEKTVYAALDATLALTIAYNIITHWVSTYRKADFLAGANVTWQSFLGKVFGPIVDREFESYAEGPKDLRLHALGMRQSRPVGVNRGQRGGGKPSRVSTFEVLN